MVSYHKRLKQTSGLSLGSHQDLLMQKLELLLECTVAHFENEEDILAQVGYPDRLEHARLHKELLDKARLFRGDLVYNKLKKSALFSFILDDVIIGHMEDEDSKFYSYTRRRPDEEIART